MLTPDQESAKLFKHYLGTSDSKAKREFFEEPINSSFTITPGQLWTYGDKIPVGDTAKGQIIQALDDGGIYSWQKSEAETIPIVKRYKDFRFSAIDAGTDNAFVLRGQDGKNLQQIIPFNFSDDSYNYTLKTSLGKQIPFGVGDWVFDTFSGVLTFYGKVPTGVDHANPPLFSFFQYVGDMGFRQDRLGLDGTVLPLTDVTFPMGKACFSDPALTEKLVSQANKVSPDFVAIYGWDGGDTNEGIALSFESLVPITYANSQDPVKGHDDSSNSAISAVISRMHSIQNDTSYMSVPFSISFVNENAKLSSTYRVEISGLTAKLFKDGIEGAPVDFTGQAILLKDADEKTFVILEKTNFATEDMSGHVGFILERRDDAVMALMYWDSQKKAYQPYVTKESRSYDTGFPVSVANGKIPPSLAVGSVPLTGYSDIITPDYYGPRVHNVIIAVDDGLKVKSADYLVKNSPGYFLDDVLRTVIAELDSSLPGVIYLRNGTYRVNSATLDLSPLRDVLILGEEKTRVIISGPTDDATLAVSFTDDASKTPCDFGIRNVTLKGGSLTIASETGKTFVLDGVIGINCDLSIIKRVNPTVMVRSCSFHAVNLTSPDPVTADTLSALSFDELTTFVYDGSFFSLATNLMRSSIRGNQIGTASLNNGGIFFKENTVGLLATKATGALVQSCQIKEYGASIAKNEYPAKFQTGVIPIYGANGFNYLKYVNLADPFTYDEQDDLIKIKLDAEVLEIDQEGRLTTCLTSDRINVGPLDFDQYAINDELDEMTRRTFQGGTLTEALNLLSKYKADLISGKVPLRQLPDAVAYGGLLYKGTWCFETAPGGAFPTAGELVIDDSDEDFSKENHVDDLQPGWFVIVVPSKDALDNNNPTRGQTASDGIIYTAGDWCVWNGKSWEKLDRAYQDACYTILAAVDPDNNPWYWKQPGATGWLDFSNVTIYEAFHRINDLFTSLIPKRPASINDASITLVVKTPLTEYGIRKIGQDGIPGTVEAAFSVDEPGAKRVVIGMPNPTSRHGLVYYGDSSTVTAVIDGSVVGSVEMNVANNNVQIAGALNITKDEDPYKDADFGSGFWKGFTADIVPVSDVSDLGEHSYSIAVDQGLPATVTSLVNGMKSKKYKLFSPYVPTAFVVGETTITDLDPTLPGAKTYLNACSGIFKLPSVFTFHLSTVLIKAFYDYVKDGTRAFIKDSIDDTYVEIPGYLLDKTDESNPADRFFDLVVNNYSKEFSVARVLEGFSFTVKVLGTVAGKDVETLIINVPTRVDWVTEQERVTSGMGARVFPVYDSDATNGLNQSGKPFVSANHLGFGFYASELMKVGRNTATGVAHEYKWPAGKYQYLKNSAIDYTDLDGVTLDQSFLAVDEDRDWMKTEQFRWVTLSKFMKDDGSFEEVILSEASGFTLCIKAMEDRLNKFVMDDLSGSTKGVAIYAKVLGLDPLTQAYLADGAGLNSGWIDCNKAFNGFSAPSMNGDPAMYAGSSTATDKRVTFGRATKSGKLIVRIGITKSSGIEFTGVSIKEVV